MSSQPPGRMETLALRERYRDDYWSGRDPIAEDRLRWRAQTFRHTTHFLPGQTVLELGCGRGMFTRALRRVTRGENPITAVTFQAGPAPENDGAETLSVEDLPGPLAGRRFDFIVGMDLLDERNCRWLLPIVHDLLEPGGQLVFYESNPWNVVLEVRNAALRLAGRRDPRRLLSRTRLYELLSEVGFVRVFAVFNDFVYAPLTRPMVWFLRNLSILLENLPGVQTLAGSILLHAQKPPRQRTPPAVSLFRHEELRRAVSVVVPCHDEEDNVERLVGRLMELYGEYVHEIVLVDDNSTDGTRAAIERLAAREPRARGVFRTPPAGVGHALKDGLAAATGRYVLSMDCDFEHLLPELRDLFDAAAEGADVAVGSRFSRHSVLLNYPFLKIFANRAFHTLAQVLFLRRFRDLTNNLRLMRREVVDDLILREPGFAVNAEIGLGPVVAGRKVREVPISWINRTPGMGVSSFRLARVGTGYWRVLVGLWLRRTLGVGPYRSLERRGPMLSTIRGRKRRHGARGGEPGRWRHATAALLAVMLLATLARLPLLTGTGLWADEVFSLAIATGHSVEHPAAEADPSLGDFVEGEGPRTADGWGEYLRHEDPPAGLGRVVRAGHLSDTSPPLYYVVLWAWTRMLGTSDVALRLLSLVCAVGCLPFIFRIGRWAGGDAVGLSASVLFAFAPHSMYYGTEGRMYSLLWLLVVAFAWTTIRLRERGPSLSRYLAWIGLAAGGFLTHYFFAFPWAACVLFALLSPGKVRRGWLCLAAGLTMLAILPWYAGLGESMERWRVTKGWLRMVPYEFDRLSSAGERFLYLFSNSAPSLWGPHRKGRAASLVLCALLGLHLAWKRRERPIGRPMLLLGLWLGAAWAGPVLLDALRGTYTIVHPRYFLAGLAAAMLIVAMALASLGPRMRLAGLALLCLAWVPDLMGIYRSRWRSDCSLREVARKLEPDTGPEDLVLLHSIPTGVTGFARYWEGEAEIAAWVQQLGVRTVPGSIESLVRGRRQVALVIVHHVGAPVPEEAWLQERGVVVEDRRQQSARIVRFVPRDGPTF